MSHPNLFTPAETPLPQIYWNTAYSKRDLIELLSALYRASVFVDKNGSQCAFKEVAQCFGQVLHVSLDYAYKERAAIDCRPRDSHSFIRMLYEKEF